MKSIINHANAFRMMSCKYALKWSIALKVNLSRGSSVLCCIFIFLGDERFLEFLTKSTCSAVSPPACSSTDRSLVVTTPSLSLANK